MVLYKYTSHYGVEVLRNLEMKITPFDQLNDPFEITPFTSARTEGELRQQLKVPEAFEAAKRNWSPGPASQAEWNAYVDRLPSVELQSVIRNQLEIPKGMIHDASMKFGMLCLSENPDRILMWSHYSDGHRGMVIGVNTDLFDNEVESFKVIYPESNERVEYRPFRSRGDPDFDKYLKELPRTKAFDWKYEGEWRWLYSLDHENVTLRPLNSGGVGYFLRIPPTAIVEVILGYRCPVETEAAVKHLIKRNGLTLKLQRADIHQTKNFEIKFTDIGLD